MSGPFTGEALKEADRILARYPDAHRRSAVLPLLHLAQKEGGGWLRQEVLDELARYLDIPPMQMRELVTFYTLFHDRPVGRHVVQVCRTTPCWLRGSEEVLGACREELGVEPGETTGDGLFTLLEVECLGACVNAPVVQIGDDYHEDLDADAMRETLVSLRSLAEA